MGQPRNYLFARGLDSNNCSDHLGFLITRTKKPPLNSVIERLKNILEYLQPLQKSYQYFIVKLD
jgi:hypothetical protein